MTTDEIERRLRLPTPDEPSVLPTLYLPVQVGTAPLSGREVGLRLGTRHRSIPLVLLGAVLLLVATLVGAVLTGALRLQQLRDAVPIPGQYAGRGITLDYPDEWTRLTPHDPLGSSGSWVALVVGNREVRGCDPDSAAVARNSPPPQPEPVDGVVDMGNQQGVIWSQEDRIYACLLERPLEAGEARMVVSRDRPQAIGLGPIGDFAGNWLAPNPEIGGPVLVSAETGFTETLGEMPARLIVRDRSVVPGAEQLRTWIVAIPRSADSMWWIQAAIRGPDLATLEAQVDTVARSLRFDDPPTALDEDDLEVALGKAIDSVDRAMREYPGRRFLACLPRTPGSVTATIDDGPRGRLVEPLEVTCTTTVTTNDRRVWGAEIEVAWPAADGHAAGRWAREILFDGEGTVHTETDIAPGTGEALGFPGDPSSTELPNTVGTFRAGDLVRSVGLGAGTAFTDVDTSKLPPEPHLFADPGAMLVILSGAEVYDGRDFYMADTGSEIGWVGAEAKGQPLLAPAQLRCPLSPNVTDLVYLSVLERRRCAIGDVSLGPARAGQVELDPSWGAVESDPAWLAAEPGWALYGAGVDSLDPGLPVVLAPPLERLPADGWITVRGHYDDPAASTCRITLPRAWAGGPLPLDAQTRRCQERFVVTSFEATEVP